MLTLLIGAALAFVGSAIGRLWFTRLELVQEKRKYLYEQVLPDLRPQISPPMIVIQRFDELRRLGALLTRSERRLVDELMAEHFTLGERITELSGTDEYGDDVRITDEDAYQTAVGVFEARRADLEAEMARRLRRWWRAGV